MNIAEALELLEIMKDENETAEQKELAYNRLKQFLSLLLPEENI